MKTTAILVTFNAVIAISAYAVPSPTARRDAALNKANACLIRNEMSSRQCKNQNQNIQILVDVYRDGDKSVLPTLFRFPYLTDFYDEALLSDPEGFLAAMNYLPEEQQEEVAVGIAGGYFKPLAKTQFVAVRTLLMKIPESSPTRHVAQTCLKALQVNNASLFLNYFPAQTFAGRAGDFQNFIYSRALYSLGQRPLWPPVSSNTTIYRFTHLGAFSRPMSVILTLLPDGTGTVNVKAVNASRDKLEIDGSSTVTGEQVTKFLAALKQADYWHMLTEVPNRGFDGADWILEGVRGGPVSSRCPMVSYGEGNGNLNKNLVLPMRLRLLLEFAGHKSGEC